MRGATGRFSAIAARQELLTQIRQLAQAAIYGTLSETYRRVWKSRLPLRDSQV
jgi:hypothetical protein